MVSIGIVGVGYTIGIANSHIKAFKRLENAKITAVYDIISGRAQDAIEKNQLSDAVACSSYEELLGLVDAVIICTPNSTHTELTVQAMKAGKHVLCEKPFADTVEACIPSVKYSELSQRVGMIGLCYRGIPGFKYIKQLIDRGELGEIYFVRQSQGGNRIANPDVKCEWRMQEMLSGSGAIADFGSHMLDITDWMLRDSCGPICQVQGMEETFIGQRDAVGGETKAAVTNGDVGMWNARYENGTLASFTASRLGCNHTLEIFGSGGWVSFNGDDPFSVTLQKKDVNGGYIDKPQVVQVPEELYPSEEIVPKVSFEVSFYLQGKEFLNAIENDATIETNFQRGLYIQRLIDAVQLSADSGEIVYIDFK